jgi:hypothetical protein
VLYVWRMRAVQSHQSAAVPTVWAVLVATVGLAVAATTASAGGKWRHRDRHGPWKSVEARVPMFTLQQTPLNRSPFYLRSEASSFLAFQLCYLKMNNCFLTWAFQLTHLSSLKTKILRIKIETIFSCLLIVRSGACFFLEQLVRFSFVLVTHKNISARIKALICLFVPSMSISSIFLLQWEIPISWLQWRSADDILYFTGAREADGTYAHALRMVLVPALPYSKQYEWRDGRTAPWRQLTLLNIGNNFYEKPRQRESSKSTTEKTIFKITKERPELVATKK